MDKLAAGPSCNCLRRLIRSETPHSRRRSSSPFRWSPVLHAPISPPPVALVPERLWKVTHRLPRLQRLDLVQAFPIYMPAVVIRRLSGRVSRWLREVFDCLPDRFRQREASRCQMRSGRPEGAVRGFWKSWIESESSDRQYPLPVLWDSEVRCIDLSQMNTVSRGRSKGAATRESAFPVRWSGSPRRFRKRMHRALPARQPAQK